MLSLRSSAATVAPEEQTPHGAQPTPKRPERRKLWFFTALSVVAGVVGASALRSPAPVSSRVHSGSPGYKQTSNGHDLHWEKKPLTVYLDDSLNKLGPGAREAVMMAFGQWVASDPRLPDLSFDTGKTSAKPARDGKSTVSYGRITTPGHERDVAITITYANDDTGEIIEADIILNALYPMGVLTAKALAQNTTNGASHSEKDRDGSDGSDGKEGSKTPASSGAAESVDCRNRYDAQNVTTHEAGHFFGLGEDPVERQATMFQTIDQCETHKRELATTDVGAIATLYAASADPEEAQAGPRACSFGGVAPSRDGLWLTAALVGLSLLRRRRAR